MPSDFWAWVISWKNGRPHAKDAKDAMKYMNSKSQTPKLQTPKESQFGNSSFGTWTLALIWRLEVWRLGFRAHVFRCDLCVRGVRHHIFSPLASFVSFASAFTASSSVARTFLSM